MAEALINYLRCSRYQAWNVGSHLTGYVHPKAIATLKRHGFDPGEPHSKSWNVLVDQRFDW